MGPLTGSPLVADYHDGAPALSAFYTGSPWDRAAYRRKLAEVRQRFDAHRLDAMARAVRPSSPAAARRLEAVVQGEGVFVTTGQQAGFLTGPLYTAYKILTAVRLARSLEAVLERPVAPLFWVASEDHDWDEASRATVLDASNRLHHVTLPGPDGGSTASMRNRVLDDGIESALREAASLLPDTEFSADVLAAVHRSYGPGRSVSDAFTAMILEFFAPFDILVADAGHEAIKELGAGILAREIRHAERHEALLADHTDRLEAAGYHAQVPVIPGATNVFFEDDAGRERILRGDDGRITLRGTGRRFDVHDLLDRLDRSPGRFSPNVLLRPVVESAVFPTLAYIAGPGELAYYAQVGCLFKAHGIDMPIVYPRPSVTLVEPKVRKVLDKFELDVDDLTVPFHELSARLVRDELPGLVRTALDDLRRDLDEGFGRLISAARAIDPTLRGPLASARNASHLQVNDAEKKILQLFRKQGEIGLAQLEKAAANLYPGGAPQERVLNVLQYLVRYGPGLLPAIADAIDIRLDGVHPAWSGVRCEDDARAGSAASSPA